MLPGSCPQSKRKPGAGQQHHGWRLCLPLVSIHMHYRQRGRRPARPHCPGLTLSARSAPLKPTGKDMKYLCARPLSGSQPAARRADSTTQRAWRRGGQRVCRQSGLHFPTWMKTASECRAAHKQRLRPGYQALAFTASSNPRHAHARPRPLTIQGAAGCCTGGRQRRKARAAQPALHGHADGHQPGGGRGGSGRVWLRLETRCRPPRPDRPPTHPPTSSSCPTGGARWSAAWRRRQRGATRRGAARGARSCPPGKGEEGCRMGVEAAGCALGSGEMHSDCSLLERRTPSHPNATCAAAPGWPSAWQPACSNA